MINKDKDPWYVCEICRKIFEELLKEDPKNDRSWYAGQIGRNIERIKM